jgi:hypothetical protein
MKRIRQSSLLLSLFLWPSQVPAQQPTDVIPGVTVRTNPIYPPIALTAHVQGDVRVKVTTDGTSVVSAEADSGPPLLRHNAEVSARTWKFASHTPATFYLEFRFTLFGGKQIAFMGAPGVVQIVAELPETNLAFYPSINLGKFEARINTRTGVSRQTLWISKTGQYGEWLNVSMRGAGGGECSEMVSGNFENEFIEFVMSRGEVDHEFKTIFAGRFTGNKIVGSFVDQDGVTGTWAAVRSEPLAADTGFNPSGCPIRSVE